MLKSDQVFLNPKDMVNIMNQPIRLDLTAWKTITWPNLWLSLGYKNVNH